MSKEIADRIKYIPSVKILISDIIFDENNPNVLTDEQKTGLELFMIKKGFAVEIWLNKQKDGKYMVIDGEHRVRILIQNGIKHVYAKIFQVPYSEVRFMRQIGNKLSGEHDKKKDADEFRAIFEASNLEEFAATLGQPLEDFQRILERSFDIEFEKPEEDPIPPLPIAPKAKRGQVFQLGMHKIICGDCTEIEDMKKVLGNKKPDLVFNDPPYNINFRYKDYKDKKTKEEYFNFCKIWYANVKQFCERMIITPGPRNMNIWYQVDPFITDIGVWREPNSSSGASVFYLRQCEPVLFYGKFSKKRVYDYFEYSAAFTKELKDAQNTHNLLANDTHAPAKPLKFIVELVKSFSNQQQIVWDNFLGNGTTLIACEQTNRICYGMELDPAYVDVIIERWEKFTGKKAKLFS